MITQLQTTKKLLSSFLKKQKINIILFGKPLSGKTTVSNYIKKQYNSQSISIGNILKYYQINNILIGDLFKNLTDNNKFLCNIFTLLLLLQHLHWKIKQQIIVFDGFPRNISQLKYFINLFPKKKTILLHIKTNKKELIQRLHNRKICSICLYNCNNYLKCINCGSIKLIKRTDDKINIFIKRLKYFNKIQCSFLKFIKKHNIQKIIIQNNKELSELLLKINKILHNITVGLF